MQVFASASPNIAFIKYWGKKASTCDEDLNLGLNPSLSLTLDNAKTEVRLKASPTGAHKFFINSELANPKDTAKLLAHMERVVKACGLSRSPPLEIISSNNFPAGTGMASSASSYAALTIALAGFFKNAKSFQELTNLLSVETLSELARRGSGSAARSVFGGFSIWDGPHAKGLNFDWPLRDTLVIFSKEHKKVPSSEGHKVAEASPHFATRLKKIPFRLEQVLCALERKDLKTLGPILEEEADELHLIAETSPTPIHYAGPETKLFLKAIKAIPQRDFFYTLDAGPNVHLISEGPIRNVVENILAELNLKAEIWEDWTGRGPVLHL